MTRSYNKLWHRLIEKGISRSELRRMAGITTNALAKLGKDESVPLETLEKVCEILECELSDVVEYDSGTDDFAVAEAKPIYHERVLNTVDAETGTALSHNLKEVVEDLLTYTYEEDWFEFKSNIFKPYEIGEYISSLSNAAALTGRTYGYLVWGVENDGHKVVGTDVDWHGNVKNEPLEHFLARQLKPEVSFKFRETLIDGKRVVALVIPAAKNAPVAFRGQRFLRVGSSKINLADYPERESDVFFVLRNGVPTIDNTPSKYQNPTFKQLFNFYSLRGMELKQETFEENLGLRTPAGEYNILSQLLSDESHIPVRFGIFAGKTKAGTFYSVREFGLHSILFTLDRILDFGNLLNIPQADEKNRISVRKEIPLFHEKAFREAATNAILHNNWVGLNAPMFSVFSDRIEIVSMGPLPSDLTRNDFFKGISSPVNPSLAEIFLQLGLTERTGKGVTEITQQYGQDAFEFGKNNITVTIPFEKVGGKMFFPWG